MEDAHFLGMFPQLQPSFSGLFSRPDTPEGTELCPTIDACIHRVDTVVIIRSVEVFMPAATARHSEFVFSPSEEADSVENDYQEC